MAFRRFAAALIGLVLWTGAAEAAPQTHAYGEDPRQTLDIYGDDDLTDAPVLLHVPGGGWANQDKAMAWSIPRMASREDILLAVMDYRAPPDFDAADQAQDVAMAVAWLKANAAAHGGDPGRIFVMGHSAGGHLAALIGVDPFYLEAQGLNLSDLAGVILLDGAAYDAALQADYLKSVYGSENASAHIFGPDISVFTPADRVRPNMGTPPFLILYVSQRGYGIRQVHALEAAFDAARVDYETAPVRDSDHVRIAYEFGEPGNPAGRAAARFIRKHSGR